VRRAFLGGSGRVRSRSRPGMVLENFMYDKLYDAEYSERLGG
jgi:hypothetical protein